MRVFDQQLALGGPGGSAVPLPTFGRARAPAPGWRERLAKCDATVDLGIEMGSRRWWRGVATCAGLCAASLALSPGLLRLQVASPVALPDAAADEARALAIMPYAMGADTGKRMGPTAAVSLLTDTPERPIVEATATLGGGTRFVAALTRSGLAPGDAEAVTRALAPIVDPDTIAPGTPVALTLGRRPGPNHARPLERMRLRARFDLAVEIVRRGGALVVTQQPIAVDRTPLRIEGPAASGIFAAATRAGAPADAVQTYLRALADRARFGALSTDARYTMVVERARAATGETRFGKLLYAGLHQDGREVRMIEWAVGGKTRWLDAMTASAVRDGYTAPLANARLTSRFGLRTHPLLRYTRMHQGVDYAAVHGAPIRAVTDGVVALAGWHGGHGKMVKLAHPNGLGSGYAHMSAIAVAPGARVRQGQIIGYVGSTGLSTGPHLHFEVYRGGGVVDPASVRFASSPLLDGAALARFKARMAALAGR